MTLLELAKSKLNITWDDTGTESRISSILDESIPAVCNMVGLSYDYDTQIATDGNGTEIDFTTPSLLRNVLMNYVAYEWNHQTNTFRENYWQEIQACRQIYVVNVEDEDGSDSE